MDAFCGKADVIYAEKFEGINRSVNWTDDQLKKIDQMLDASLLDP